MAAGTTFISKTLDEMALNAGAIAGLTARVYQGYRIFTDAANVEDAVRALTTETQGLLALWFSGLQAGRQDTGQPGTMTIKGILFVKLEKDTTTDANSMYDFIKSIVTALMVASEYRGWAVTPLSVDLNETTDPHIDGIAEWELSFEFQTPALCGSD